MKINLHYGPLSLAHRLTLFISITTIVAFLLFSWMMIDSVKQHFEQQDLNELQQLMTTMQNILMDQSESEKVRIDKITKVVAGHDNIFIYLQNNQQKILFQTSDGPDFNQIIRMDGSCNVNGKVNLNNIVSWQPEAGSLATYWDTHVQQKSTSYRVAELTINLASQNKTASYRLLIAQSIDFHLHYIQNLTHNLSLVALLSCLFIILVVHFAVYQAHAPLRRVSQKIQSITSENLHLRLQPNVVPIELKQLVISFNTMIEQIEEVFKRQSYFSADIAHEMRTPITNLVTQTQIALSQQRSITDYQDVLYSNLEEYERMAKMVNDMLFLAQADNNLLIPEITELDLKKEVDEIFDYFEALAEERSVLLQFQGTISPIRGDRLMLRRAISNLLSNAIRYTPNGHKVLVSFSSTSGQVQLIVENQGTVIPAEHIPRLFDRFYRVDKSRQRNGEGSGIGLSIVKSIVLAHQGTISVISDQIATKFIVTLPRKLA